MVISCVGSLQRWICSPGSHSPGSAAATELGLLWDGALGPDPHPVCGDGHTQSPEGFGLLGHPAGWGQAGESPALPRAVFALITQMSFSLSSRKLISTFELAVCTQLSLKSMIFALLETLNLLFLTTPNFLLYLCVFPFSLSLPGVDVTHS